MINRIINITLTVEIEILELYVNGKKKHKKSIKHAFEVLVLILHTPTYIDINVVDTSCAVLHMSELTSKCKHRIVTKVTPPPF